LLTGYGVSNIAVLCLLIAVPLPVKRKPSKAVPFRLVRVGRPVSRRELRARSSSESPFFAEPLALHRPPARLPCTQGGQYGFLGRRQRLSLRPSPAEAAGQLASFQSEQTTSQASSQNIVTSHCPPFSLHIAAYLRARGEAAVAVGSAPGPSRLHISCPTRCCLSRI